MASVIALLAGVIAMQDPDFDKLWNYDKPDETEKRFRELLPTIGDRKAELLTQIARTQGLQRNFDEAHRTLDEAEKLATGLRHAEAAAPAAQAGGVARVRYLLERGRVFNSSKQKEKAKPLFVQALEAAQAGGHDTHAIDAAHMLGIVCEPKEALEWNTKAIAMAEASKDAKAKGWLGALYNNVGWTYHDSGEFEKALEIFRKALAWRAERKQETETRVAKWCVARALRSLKKVEEALAMQRELLKEWEEAKAEDGYVFEELGECVLALGKADEAKPHFARAWELLSKDAWLAENEAKRLARLKELGGK